MNEFTLINEAFTSLNWIAYCFKSESVPYIVIDSSSTYAFKNRKTKEMDKYINGKKK